MAVRALLAPVLVVGLLAHFAGIAAADSPSPDSNSCATECISQTISNGKTSCKSATDTQCLCSNAEAIADIGLCIKNTCPQDQQAAINFLLSQCASFISTATSDSTAATETSSSAVTTQGATSASVTSDASSGTLTSSDSHHAHNSSSASETSKAASDATETSAAASTTASSGVTTTLVVPASSDPGPVTTLGVSATGDATAGINTAGLASNATGTVSSGSIMPAGTSVASNKTSGAMALGAQIPGAGGMAVGVVVGVAAAMFGAGILL